MDLSKLNYRDLIQVILCSGLTFLGTCREMREYIIANNLVGSQEFLNAVLYLSINDDVCFWIDTKEMVSGSVHDIDYKNSKIEVLYMSDKNEPEFELLEHHEVWANNGYYS